MLGGGLKTKKKAIKWMNTFDLARSKEMEKIILNLGASGSLKTE